MEHGYLSAQELLRDMSYQVKEVTLLTQLFGGRAYAYG